MDLQETENSCGRACVREALRTVWPRVYKDFVIVEESCADFLSIRNELEKDGVVTSARTDVTVDELEKNLPGPAILQFKSGFDYHFVVLKSLKKKKAVIYDPACGEYKTGIDEAFEGFTGKVLILSPGQKPEKQRGFKPLDLLGTGTKVGLAFLALFRGLLSFMFFAMISSAEYALGSLLPLVLFLISLVATIALSSSENNSFATRRVLPNIHSRRRSSRFFDAMEAHSSAMSLYEAFWDCFAFLLLGIFIFGLQNTDMILLFCATVFLFFACEFFLRKLLSRSYALTCKRENRMRQVDEKQRTLVEDYSFAKEAGKKYLWIAAVGRIVAFSMVLLALVGYFRFLENPSASDFISDAFVLLGSGISVIRMLSTRERFTNVRKNLYKLPVEMLNAMQKKNAKRYNASLNGSKENSSGQ